MRNPLAVALSNLHDAADEITRLRALNAQLVEALEFAFAQLGGPPTKIKNQNEAYCDGYEKCRVTLAAAKR